MSPSVVKRVKYPGTLDQFRGLMQRLRDRHRDGLAVADGQPLSFCEERQQRFHLRPDATWDPRGVRPDAVERVEDVTPPSRGTWRIERLGPDGQPDMWCGYMQAYESPSGVVLEFSVAGSSTSDSATNASSAAALRQFATRIMEAVACDGDACRVLGEDADAFPVADEPVHAERPRWFPKTKDRRELWAKKADVMDDLDKEYRELYDEGQTKSPQPTFDEYAEAIVDRLRETHNGEDTLRNIRKARREGWI